MGRYALAVALAALVCCAHSEQDGRMALHEELSSLIQSGEEVMASWNEQAAGFQASPEIAVMQEAASAFQDKVDSDYDKIFNHGSTIAKASPVTTQVLEAVPSGATEGASTKLKLTRAQKKASKMVREHSEAEKINQGLADAREMLGSSLTKGSKFANMAVPSLPTIPKSKQERKQEAKEKLKMGMDLFKKLTDPPHVPGARSWAGVYGKNTTTQPHDVVPAEWRTTPAMAPPTLPKTPPKTEAAPVAPVAPKAPPVAPTVPANIESTLEASPKEATVHSLPSVHVPSVEEEAAWTAETSPVTKTSQKLAAVAKAISRSKKAAVSPIEMSDEEFKLDLKTRVKANPVFKHARDQGLLEHIGDEDPVESDDKHGDAVFSFFKSVGMEGHLRDEYRPLSELDLEEDLE